MSRSSSCGYISRGYLFSFKPLDRCKIYIHTSVPTYLTYIHTYIHGTHAVPGNNYHQTTWYNHATYLHKKVEYLYRGRQNDALIYKKREGRKTNQKSKVAKVPVIRETQYGYQEPMPIS